jgi:hypothetical protein
MTEPVQCIAFGDALEDAVLLAARLVDKSVLKTPQLLIAALQSHAGQNELKKAFMAVAKERLKDAPVQFSPEEASRFQSKLQQAGITAFTTGVLEQVKKGAEYRRLQMSADQLVRALKCSPAGVWVDEHEALVYLLGGGVILGGATALYLARTGDTITGPVMDLIKGKKKSFKVHHNLEVAAGLAKFVPSQRDVEVAADATAKWKPLQVKLDLKVHAVNEKFSVAAGGQVILPFKGGAVTFEGSHNTRDPKGAATSFGVGVRVGEEGRGRIDIFAKTNLMDGNPAGGSLGVRVGPSRKMPVSFGGSMTADRDTAALLLTLDF